MKIKILRAHYVTYSWKNCLSREHTPLNPSSFGWHHKDGMILPLWYEGSNLPSDEKYYEHINANAKKSDLLASDLSDSETESESELDDENPLSDYYSSSEDEV